MKRTIFAILAGFLLVACTSMQAPLEPETPQSSSSLPKINDAMGIDSARLIARRFAPWNIKTIDEKPDSLLWGVNSYKFRAKKPWYGANLKPLKPEFFARLAKNVARDDIGKVSAYAITLRDTALRALPSAAPLFQTLKKQARAGLLIICKSQHCLWGQHFLSRITQLMVRGLWYVMMTCGAG